MRSSSSAAITRRASNGEDRETAFYTMYHGTAHVILGSGLTIAGATFCLHFTRLPYFQTLGIPLGDRHARRGRGGADHGARVADHLQSVRPVRSEAGDEDSRLAPDRHRRRALAGPDSRRVGGSRAGGSAGAAVVQAELQRPQLPALGHPGQSGLRGRRPALPAGPDEPGDAAGRDRPRCAQLSGHVGHRPNRQGHLPHSRHRQGAGHHPAGGHSDRTHVDPVPDQHAGHHPADEPGLHGQSHGQHAEAGQRHADDHRHDGEDAKPHHADGGDHAQHGRRRRRT